MYEFDLRGFFPSVKLKEIIRILTEEEGYPELECKFLLSLLQSITKLTDKDRDDESEGDDRFALITGSGNPSPNLPPSKAKAVLEIVQREFQGED